MTNLWLFGDQKCLVHQMSPYCLMTIPPARTSQSPEQCHMSLNLPGGRLHGMLENPWFIVDFGISQPALITGNDHVKGETVTRCLLAWQP